MISMRGRLHNYYGIILEISNVKTYLFRDEFICDSLLSPNINFQVNYKKLPEIYSKNQ